MHPAYRFAEMEQSIRSTPPLVIEKDRRITMSLLRPFSALAMNRLGILTIVIASGCATSTENQVTLLDPPLPELVATAPSTAPPGAPPVTVQSHFPQRSQAPPLQPVTPIGSTALNAGEQLPHQIERRIGYAFDLANRGAMFAATTEFRAVLEQCALELDARDGGTRRRAALREGLIALEEADDFANGDSSEQNPAEIQTIAARHSTWVLHAAHPQSIDPPQAARKYFEFAEDRLKFACEGMPPASLACYGLGQAMADPRIRAAHALEKATVLQRAALHIAPQNVMAGKELSALLFQQSRFDESKLIAQQSDAMAARPEAWKSPSAAYALEREQSSPRESIATNAVSRETNRTILQTQAQQPIENPSAPNNEMATKEEGAAQGILARLKLTSDVFTILR